MQAHPLWSGNVGPVNQLTLAQKGVIRGALAEIARAANADPLINKIKKSVTDFSRKDDKLIKEVSSISQLAAWRGLVRAGGRLAQHNRPSESFIAQAVGSFATVSNILGIADFGAANFSRGAGGAEAAALNGQILPVLNTADLPQVQGMRANVSHNAQDGAHAAYQSASVRALIVRGDQKSIETAKLIVAGSAAIAGNIFTLLTLLGINDPYRGQVAQQIALYYANHHDEPITDEIISHEIEQVITANVGITVDQRDRLRGSIEAVSKRSSNRPGDC